MEHNPDLSAELPADNNDRDLLLAHLIDKLPFNEHGLASSEGPDHRFSATLVSDGLEGGELYGIEMGVYDKEGYEKEYVLFPSKSGIEVRDIGPDSTSLPRSVKQATRSEVNQLLTELDNLK